MWWIFVSFQLALTVLSQLGLLYLGILPVTINATAWLLSTPMIGWASIVVTWCATFLNGKDFNFSKNKNNNYKCVFKTYP